MDQKNLADLYSLDPIPWSRALELLLKIAGEDLSQDLREPSLSD
jgi:hypothetical protein